MASINFIDFETVIPASWLNEVDALVHAKRVLLSRNTDQSLAADTLVAVQWNNEVEDTGDLWDPGQPTRIVAPANGRMRFTMLLTIGDLGANPDQTTMLLARNGETSIDEPGLPRVMYQPTAQFVAMPGSTPWVAVSANDYFELYAFQTSDTEGTIDGDNNRTWIGAEFVPD